MHEVRLERREAGQRVSARVLVPDGASLLGAVRRAGLPIALGCAAGALCGSCALQVLDGASALSEERDHETRAKRRNRVSPTERLACTSRVHGPVTLTASYW